MELRGQVNRYVCPSCGAEIHTIHAANGVTPFMIRCIEDDCGAMMQSEFYRLSYHYFCRTAGKLTIEYVWYRPSKADYDKADSDTQMHLRSGGLLLTMLGERDIPFDNVPAGGKEALAAIRELYGVPQP